MRFNKILLTLAVIIMCFAPSLAAKKYWGENADSFNQCFDEVDAGVVKCQAEHAACWADSVCKSASLWAWFGCSTGICNTYMEYYDYQNKTGSIGVQNIQCQKGCDIRGQPAWDTHSYHLYQDYVKCFYHCYEILGSNYLQTMLGLSLILLVLLFSSR